RIQGAVLMKNQLRGAQSAERGAQSAERGARSDDAGGFGAPRSALGAQRLNWPLMRNNIAREDLDAVGALLAHDDPILTPAPQVLARLTSRTRAVFITHVLGNSALTRRMLDELGRCGNPLLEDTCRSHGATFDSDRLGSIGLDSKFPFYYAHDLSTIEGGVVC